MNKLTQPTQSTRRTLTIVIPARNEKGGIEGTIHAIPKDELEGMGYEVEVLVVDNGSDDGTGELAKRAGAEVVFEPRPGYGQAYKTGFAHATSDIIATADADLTYPIDDIPRLVKTLEEEKLDFLTTNRFALMDRGAMSFRNKVGNTALSLATRILFRLKLRDPESGMWVFRKNVLNKAKLGSDTWPFSHELKIEVCYYTRCRWKEVPIRYGGRSGETKLLSGWKVGFTDLFHIMKKRIIR